MTDRRLRSVHAGQPVRSVQVGVGITGYDLLRPCGTFDAYRRHAAKGQVCDACDCAFDQLATTCTAAA